MLQQIIVRPRPAEPVAEMFRNWSTSERSGDVGLSVVDRVSGDLVGHVTLFGASLPVRACSQADGLLNHDELFENDEGIVRQLKIGAKCRAIGPRRPEAFVSCTPLGY